MEPDALLLARLQFAFTISVHIIFPAFSIGSSAYVATLLVLWRRSGHEHFHRLARFWTNTVSPYQSNPFDINPLKDFVAHQVDFERLAHYKGLKVFVVATRVSTGKAEAKAAEKEGEIEKLHAKIGQLVVERDFLAKASGR